MRSSSKFAFTLVELLIGLLLLAIIGSTLTFKITDAYRHEQAKGLKNQLLSLFTMARHYAVINGDGADLIFRKDEQDTWIGYIIVFNKDYKMKTSCTPKSFFTLSNVSSMSVNNQSVSTARFRFFAWTGLSEVSLNGHHQNTALENISITCTTLSNIPCTFEIPEKEFSYVTKQFPPFPDEFYTQ